MIINNPGNEGRIELSQCVHYLQQYFFDFDMCSVGVVVITSALHAVGHGFETHTEYFFSHEENIDQSFCPLAPQYSLLHFSVVEKRNRTFLLF